MKKQLEQLVGCSEENNHSVAEAVVAAS